MKIRMKDIAEMANVSLTSVSLVLNNKPTRISEKKRKEILSLAKKYNYTPNRIAQSLATNKSHVIGIIIPNIENPFFASIVKKAEEKLREYGYISLIMNTNDSEELDIKMIEHQINFNVDGLLIVLSNELLNNQKRLMKIINRLSFPVIIMDRQIDNQPSINQVYYDNVYGGYMATKHLIDLGHRNIGVMMSNQLTNGRKRYSGYLEALKEANIPFDKKLYIETEINFDEGYKNADKILQMKEVTAIFAVNDLVAFGAMKRATELGISIPEDVSLIGYDNLYINEFMNVKMTSINQNVDLLIESSIKLLLKNIENNNIKKKSIMLKPELIQRDSTARVRNVKDKYSK